MAREVRNCGVNGALAEARAKGLPGHLPEHWRRTTLHAIQVQRGNSGIGGGAFWSDAFAERIA